MLTNKLESIIKKTLMTILHEKIDFCFGMIFVILHIKFKKDY